MQKLLSFSKYSISIVCITLLALVFTGCGKKSEEEQKTTPLTEEQKVTEQKSEQNMETAGESEPAETNKPEEASTHATPNLLGKWTGTLAERVTTLTITEQNGLKFKGNITINFRNVVNQQVEGNFKIETGELLMDDLIHTKYMGKYRALFVGGFEKMNGTFTQTSDKNTATFTLTKNK